MKNLLFSFEDLSAKDKAAKQAVRYFSRAARTWCSRTCRPP